MTHYLNLRRTDIVDAGLGHLKTVTNLGCPIFGSDRITDAGPRHLQHLIGLEMLSTYGDITDKDLVHLKNLMRLKRLYLNNTSISCEGLVHLSALEHLVQLVLTDSRITDTGFVRLKNLISPRSSDL